MRFRVIKVDSYLWSMHIKFLEHLYTSAVQTVPYFLSSGCVHIFGLA